MPVSGYFLSFRLLTPGAAGTEFKHAAGTFAQLCAGEMSDAQLSRLATVLMSGVAAEAMTFGNAEGGADDDAKLVLLIRSMRPEWDDSRVIGMGRWAVLQAVLLLHEYQDAYEALAAAMRAGAPLGTCIAAVEANLPHAVGHGTHWPGQPAEVTGG
jgi:hypothetical protein